VYVPAVEFSIFGRVAPRGFADQIAFYPHPFSSVEIGQLVFDVVSPMYHALLHLFRSNLSGIRISYYCGHVSQIEKVTVRAQFIKVSKNLGVFVSSVSFHFFSAVFIVLPPRLSVNVSFLFSTTKIILINEFTKFNNKYFQLFCNKSIKNLISAENF
jgi:hypothetical protein